MHAEMKPSPRIGYCTNVHAGATLEAMQRELDTHAVHVREIIAPDDMLDIGLWLSASAAEELVSTNGVPAFRDWLSERGLRVFTMNGFPYGDFHGEVVKHRVYEPSWAETERTDYTMNLARILAGLIDEGERASISTVPIGWPGAPCKPVDQPRAASRLRNLAKQLAQLREETGRFVTVDLEPEPGCILQTSFDVVRFFSTHLTGAHVRSHLGICHDICHAVVMFEDQRAMFARYREAGIAVNKIQVSNAPRAVLEGFSDRERMEIFAALRAFEEPRYLHQTTVRMEQGIAMYEDLPAARARHESLDRLGDEWRVHFHVPIYLESLGKVETTRVAINECLRAMRDLSVPPVLEVETYAWDVLPAEHRGATLAEDIAREITWLRELITARSGSSS